MKPTVVWLQDLPYKKKTEEFEPGQPRYAFVYQMCNKKWTSGQVINSHDVQTSQEFIIIYLGHKLNADRLVLFVMGILSAG